MSLFTKFKAKYHNLRKFLFFYMRRSNYNLKGQTVFCKISKFMTAKKQGILFARIELQHAICRTEDRYSDE